MPMTFIPLSTFLFSLLELALSGRCDSLLPARFTYMYSTKEDTEEGMLQLEHTVRMAQKRELQ